MIAIAHSAQEIRSPDESSMSISRGSGVAETSSAIVISSSVVLPRADSTTTTRWPASRFSTIRRAARLMRSASATEVPPNFMTINSDMLRRILPSARLVARSQPRPSPPVEAGGQRKLRSSPTGPASSDGAATGKSLAERHLVGILEVRAHG